MVPLLVLQALETQAEVIERQGVMNTLHTPLAFSLQLAQDQRADGQELLCRYWAERLGGRDRV